MNKRVLIVSAAAMLWTVTAVARESWVLFGSALGFRTGCEPSYIWTAEPVFHNTSATDQQINVLHQPASAALPSSSFTVRAGESLAIWGSSCCPPGGLTAVKLDIPSEVAVEQRLEYWNILPCSGLPPPLAPSGKIAMPSFRLVDAQQPQHHYGLDLGFQSVRVNVGVYNAGASAATAIVELRRPACDDAATTIITIPPDTLVQVSARVPPVCVSPKNSPYYIVNGSVIVDQPSFSYATTVSNLQPPNVTFGVGTP